MNDVVLAAAMIITYPVALVTMMKSHYVYEKHPNVITALFFPTKETVWEHTKLFFLPNILILFILNLIFRESYPNFQSVAGIVTITMSILPVILYPIMAKICDIKKRIRDLLFNRVNYGYTTNWLHRHVFDGSLRLSILQI